MDIRILHSFESEALFLQYEVFISCSGCFAAVHTWILMCIHLQHQFAFYHVVFVTPPELSHTNPILPSYHPRRVNVVRLEVLQWELTLTLPSPSNWILLRHWILGGIGFFWGGLGGGYGLSWSNMSAVFCSKCLFVVFFSQVDHEIFMNHNIPCPWPHSSELKLSIFSKTKLAIYGHQIARERQGPFRKPTRSQELHAKP